MRTMRTCKHCKQPIHYSLSGLKSFCSHTCRKEYRQDYYRNHKRIQRQNNHVHNSGGYVDINMPNVHNLDGIKSRFCEGQNQGHGLFEDMKPKDLSIAKECCNFEMKKKEGYCITMHEPYFCFKVGCVECPLFSLLGGER
jgi:hypothetical protein